MGHQLSKLNEIPEFGPHLTIGLTKAQVFSVHLWCHTCYYLDYYPQHFTSRETHWYLASNISQGRHSYETDPPKNINVKNFLLKS